MGPKREALGFLRCLRPCRHEASRRQSDEEGAPSSRESRPREWTRRRTSDGCREKWTMNVDDEDPGEHLPRLVAGGEQEREDLGLVGEFADHDQNERHTRRCRSRLCSHLLAKARARRSGDGAPIVNLLEKTAHGVMSGSFVTLVQSSAYFGRRRSRPTCRSALTAATRSCACDERRRRTVLATAAGGRALLLLWSGRRATGFWTDGPRCTKSACRRCR